MYKACMDVNPNTCSCHRHQSAALQLKNDFDNLQRFLYSSYATSLYETGVSIYQSLLLNLKSNHF